VRSISLQFLVPAGAIFQGGGTKWCWNRLGANGNVSVSVRRRKEPEEPQLSDIKVISVKEDISQNVNSVEIPTISNPATPSIWCRGGGQLFQPQFFATAMADELGAVIITIQHKVTMTTVGYGAGCMGCAIRMCWHRFEPNFALLNLHCS
jgi:hypothetical protein